MPDTPQQPAGSLQDSSQAAKPTTKAVRARNYGIDGNSVGMGVTLNAALSVRYQSMQASRRSARLLDESGDIYMARFEREMARVNRAVVIVLCSVRKAGREGIRP